VGELDKEAIIRELAESLQEVKSALNVTRMIMDSKEARDDAGAMVKRANQALTNYRICLRRD